MVPLDKLRPMWDALKRWQSGTALARMAQERLGAGASAGASAGERSVMIEFAGGDIAAVDAGIVVQAAHQDDALAQSLMQEVGRSLASGIITLMHIF